LRVELIEQHTTSSMLKMKKAEADMWWIIVGACETTGGTCVGVDACRTQEGGTPSSLFECPDLDGQKQECCFGIKKK